MESRKSRSTDKLVHVAAIGASAGGLEACQKLLQGLTAGAGTAYLIVQHLDPDHESALVDLLAKHTEMTVSEAKDGMKIKPDNVYIIPPGFQISVKSDRLKVEPFDTAVRPRFPFDHLLISMAKELGSRAVAVVLSGTGSDGSVGIKDIHTKGGLVLAQDPAEATFDGMPRSAIETGQVTHIAPLKDLSKQLMHLEHTTDTSQIGKENTIKDNNFDRIISVLLASTAYDFRNYKSGTLHRRIQRRLEACNLAEADVEKYIDILQSTPDEVDRLVQDLLINVTDFFRDTKVFQHLEAHVIPKLVRERAHDLPIRVWIAGCSTGQEAYSIAILFKEILAREGSNSIVQIFASDVDREAVAEAREGVYRDVKGLSEKRLTQYFTHENGAWRVTPDLRSMVTFTVHDVLSDPPFLRLDLLSCRNLLIYLKPDAQLRLMGLFHYALVPGGLLLLGTAETVGRMDDRFTSEFEESCLYRNQRNGVLDIGQFIASPQGLGTQVGSALTLQHQTFDPGELLRNKVLERHTTATALVNASYECLYMIGPADQYFRVSEGRPVSGILAMARDGVAIELRRALEEAARSNKTTVATGGHLRGTDTPNSFTVTVEPIEHAGQKLFMVRVSPTEPPATVQALTGPFNAHVMALERELDETRAELGKALREMQNISSRQYAALAEAKSVQEEYQASNEELLSSKEELQSLNEELSALNAQLQGALAREKSSANDLQNILYSTDTATLFLDAKLLVRFFTPGVAAMFKLRPVDIGRPLDELTLLASDTTLFADIKSALKAGERVSADIQTQSGTWFNRSALPYKTRDGQVDGVVITLDDITERKRHEVALEVQTTSASLARARLESAIGSLPDAFAYYDADNVLVMCNARYRDLHTALGIPIAPGFRFDQLKIEKSGSGQQAQTKDEYASWIAKRAKQRKPLNDNRQVQMADGRWFSLIDTPTPDGGWVNMLIDITPSKITEQQLSERASAIAAVNEGIAMTDSDRNLTFMNTACCTMFGITKEQDVSGQNWLTLYATDSEAHMKAANSALKRHGAWRGSLIGRRLDGNTFDVEVSITLMPNGNLVIISRDVSKRNAEQRDRDKLRDQLLIAERRETVNVILAGLVHDLNNLLAVISGTVELMLEGDTQESVAALTPVFAKQLGRIQLATQQSGTLLKRLMQMGGRELAHKKFDIRQSIQEAADLLRVGLTPNVSLNLHLPTSAVDIYADPIDILQIVLNLGLNARDSLGNGPQKIDIALSKASPSEMVGPLTVGDVEAGRPYLCLSVTDTGSGISPTVLTGIFDAYFSTKGDAGNGLGLPIVKEIVGVYGGAIKVESTVGHGSRFIVLLPILPKGQEASNQAQRKNHTTTDIKEIDLHGRVALVVDDNDEFRALVSSFLEEAGIEVISCADPHEALQAVEESPDGCDVLVTDLNMPHMNGVQLAEAIAKVAPDLPMIMITASLQRSGSKMDADQKRLFRAVLSKPIKKSQIIEALFVSLGQDH